MVRGQWHGETAAGSPRVLVCVVNDPECVKALGLWQKPVPAASGRLAVVVAAWVDMACPPNLTRNWNLQDYGMGSRGAFMSKLYRNLTARTRMGNKWQRQWQ